MTLDYRCPICGCVWNVEIMNCSTPQPGDCPNHCVARVRRGQMERDCRIIDEAIEQIHTPLLTDEQHDLLSGLQRRMREGLE